eukprot:scaffold261_cov336-Pavlova_lutheri.AAC.5
MASRTNLQGHVKGYPVPPPPATGNGPRRGPRDKKETVLCGASTIQGRSGGRERRVPAGALLQGRFRTSWSRSTCEPTLSGCS